MQGLEDLPARVFADGVLVVEAFCPVRVQVGVNTCVHSYDQTDRARHGLKRHEQRQTYGILTAPPNQLIALSKNVWLAKVPFPSGTNASHTSLFACVLGTSDGGCGHSSSSASPTSCCLPIPNRVEHARESRGTLSRNTTARHTRVAKTHSKARRAMPALLKRSCSVRAKLRRRKPLLRRVGMGGIVVVAVRDRHSHRDGQDR